MSLLGTYLFCGRWGGTYVSNTPMRVLKAYICPAVWILDCAKVLQVMRLTCQVGVSCQRTISSTLFVCILMKVSVSFLKDGLWYLRNEISWFRSDKDET